MRSICVLDNGETFAVDHDTRRVVSRGGHTDVGRFVADYAQSLLDTGALVGPQVDDLAGIGGWETGVFHAMRDAARQVGRTVTLFTTTP